MVDRASATSFRPSDAALAELDRIAAQLNCSRTAALEFMLLGSVPRRRRRTQPHERPQPSRLAELHAATVLIRALGRVFADSPSDADSIVRELATAALALIQGRKRYNDRLAVGHDPYLQLPAPQDQAPPPDLVARILRYGRHEGS